MKNGLLVAGGIAIGLVIAVAVGVLAHPAMAAQQQAGAAANNGPMILGTGGSTQNQIDICWVLSKVQPAKGPERTVLALYRAKNNGNGVCHFDLEDVRMIDADMRLLELQGAAHKASNTDVKTIAKLLSKEDQEALKEK